MGESASGNARAVSYRFAPIVRMTNTYIDQGSVAFDHTIKDGKRTDGIEPPKSNWAQALDTPPYDAQVPIARTAAAPKKCARSRQRTCFTLTSLR